MFWRCSGFGCTPFIGSQFWRCADQSRGHALEVCKYAHEVALVTLYHGGACWGWGVLRWTLRGAVGHGSGAPSWLSGCGGKGVNPNERGRL